MNPAQAADGPAVVGERMGEVALVRTRHGLEMRHRADVQRPADELTAIPASGAEDLAKFDAEGKFRPLRTVPTLPRGWRVPLRDADEVDSLWEVLYPGRQRAWNAFRHTRLQVTPLRETLDRQTGMYRVAAKISDNEISELVGRFCRSDGGCLRTILWRRDASGALPSENLPREKYDPAWDQTGQGEMCTPLLCQEACGLLVAEARKVVKGE